MKLTDLKQGDVLLFTARKNQSLFSKIIHLITGSCYTHCAILVKDHDDSLLVLEQLNIRTITPLQNYILEPDELVVALRPKFCVITIPWTLLSNVKYGNVLIIDCMINHFVGLFKLNNQYRPHILNLYKDYCKQTCSALVARALNLPLFTNWCKYTSVVEPDDFYNHIESFDHLGEVEFNG